jgi:hypothetical protein
VASHVRAERAICSARSGVILGCYQYGKGFLTI